MPRKPHPIAVEEFSGNEYPDLVTAQHAALPEISKHLVSIIHRLLEDGTLVNRNGKIVPNTEKKK